MADSAVPHFHNEPGVREIHVGAREFMCIGALPPSDHPHIFIDMGDEDEAVCAYCSTLFRFQPALHADQCEPAECLWAEPATA